MSRSLRSQSLVFTEILICGRLVVIEHEVLMLVTLCLPVQVQIQLKPVQWILKCAVKYVHLTIHSRGISQWKRYHVILKINSTEQTFTLRILL